jgi:hypothetical protein
MYGIQEGQVNASSRGELGFCIGTWEGTLEWARIHDTTTTERMRLQASGVSLLDGRFGKLWSWNLGNLYSACDLRMGNSASFRSICG